MAKLNDTVRRFMVIQLARFETPQAVSDMVREQFDIDIPRNRVHEYDASGYRRDVLAKKWRAIFDAERARFLAETDDIGVANKAVRLNRLQRMFEKAERMGNMALAAQLLEQAAKETGGMYTNKRELGGKIDVEFAEKANRIWEARKRVGRS